MNRKYPIRSRFYNFQHFTPTLSLSPQTPDLLNRRRCMVSSGECIKNNEKANRHKFHVWNSHCQHVAPLFRQCRTISFFSATTGYLLEDEYIQYAALLFEKSLSACTSKTLLSYYKVALSQLSTSYPLKLTTSWTIYAEWCHLANTLKQWENEPRWWRSICLLLMGVGRSFRWIQRSWRTCSNSDKTRWMLSAGKWPGRKRSVVSSWINCTRGLSDFFAVTLKIGLSE